MQYLRIKADGSIDVIYPNLDAQEASDRQQRLSDEGSSDQIVQWTGDLSQFAKPVWDVATSTVIEGADTATAQQSAEDVRAKLMQDVDEYAGAKFFAVLTTPTDSLELTLYKFAAHLAKKMEANDVVNDRDNPQYKHWPVKVRGGASKLRNILSKEASRRGVSESDMADQVNFWADLQDDLIATIEEYRPVARDSIETYTLTGNYMADVTALQAIYDQYVIDLDSAVNALLVAAGLA